MFFTKWIDTYQVLKNILNFRLSKSENMNNVIKPINAQFSSWISVIKCHMKIKYSLLRKIKILLSPSVQICLISVSTDFYACFLGLPLEETKYWWASQASSSVGLHSWASASCNKKYMYIIIDLLHITPLSQPYPFVKKSYPAYVLTWFLLFCFIVKLNKKQAILMKQEKN